MIMITVPNPTADFSFFADGCVADVVTVNDRSLVVLNDDYAIHLYYKIRNHRHLYVCKKKIAAEKLPSKCFDGVPEPLSILAELTGRSLDRYKRAVWRLKKIYGDKIMTLPYVFFWQLSVQCAVGHNSTENINGLLQKYTDLKIKNRCSSRNIFNTGTEKNYTEITVFKK